MHNVNTLSIMARICRIVRVADNMSYFESGYAWIFTEAALPSDFQFAEDNMPPGLLAIDGYERDIYPDILQAVIDVFKYDNTFFQLQNHLVM